MSIIDDEDVSNTSNNEHFQDIVSARVSRRGFLTSGLATAAAVSLGGVEALLKAVPAAAQETEEAEDTDAGVEGRDGLRPVLGFESVPVSTTDEVVVPKGYTAEVLIAWGDPVEGRRSSRREQHGRRQARQWGMHNDGSSIFRCSIPRGLLVQNNEYTDDGLLFPDGASQLEQEKTDKSLNAHGVSIIEISEATGVGNRDVQRAVGGNGSRAAVPYRAPHHRHDADPDRRARRPAMHRLMTSADPTGTTGARHAQQLRHGLHAMGHVSGVRGELQRLFRKTGAARTEARTPLRHHRRRRRLPLAHDRQAISRRRGAERAEPLRLGGRDRSVQSALDAGEAHRARAPEARGCVGAGGAGRPRRRLHGRRRAYEYIYRYVSNRPGAGATGTASIRSMTACSTSPSSSRRTGEWLPLTPDNPALAGWSLERHPDQHARGGRCGRRDEDGPARVDRHVPRSLTAIATLTNNNRAARRPPSVTNPAARRRGLARPPGRRDQSARQQRLRPHHPLVLHAGFHRADVRLGHLRAVRRPGESRPTAPRSSATSTARRTASTWRRAAGCGSRPTCRPARSTRAPTPASATTRCCAPTRRPARPGASSSARTAARSPACS